MTHRNVFSTSCTALLAAALLAAALLAAPLLAACDSSSTTPPPDTALDGPPPPLADAVPPSVDAPAPPPDAPLPPAACNQLEPSGEWVSNVRIPAAPPVMTGGTLADGTYRLVSWTTYTGIGGISVPGTLSLRQTLKFEGGTFSQVTAVLAPAQVQRGVATITIAGANITFVSTCTTSFGGTSMMGYTATSSELRLLGTTGDLFVLTRL